MAVARRPPQVRGAAGYASTCTRDPMTSRALVPLAAALAVVAPAWLAGCEVPVVPTPDGYGQSADPVDVGAPPAGTDADGDAEHAHPEDADAGPADTDADAHDHDDHDHDVEHGGEVTVVEDNPDLAVDWSCQDDAWAPGACGPPTTTFAESIGATHIDVPEPLAYEASPPSSGPHRPQWGKWGEYEFMPPQRWLHNLEHGGVAILYHPCADAALVESLRAFAQAQPDDDGGAFRWVLSPYVDAPAAVLVVAWENVWAAECLDEESLAEFVAEHYRQAPEDIANAVLYDTMWLGK